MNEPQVAIYARVSSEQQSEAKTIESQLSDLRAHVKALGLMLPSEHEFVDNGYSGSNLIRPALEQLRDVVAAGGIDQVYVHCPDRLARNYAHQVLLLEEFLRAGVDVNFLNREVGQTPEDQLLLQVQGMIAEYERAKILERSRRGKRHAAQGGSVSVLPWSTLWLSLCEPRMMEMGKHVLMCCLRKHASCVKCLAGWDTIAARLGRCAVA